MERRFFGSSLLRKAGRVFVLATLAGSVACGGCDDDPPNTNNTNNMSNNNSTGTNNGTIGTNNSSNNNNGLEDGSITVSPTMLQIDENGGSGEFTIVLDAEPASDVTIDIVSTDESEATASPASLTFTADNWDTAQTVTVDGVDDADVDGTQNIIIQTNVTGSDNYDGVDAADVNVAVLDDDVAIGGSVMPTGVTVSEDGTTATFSVVLSAAPTGDVTIPISVSDDTEIAVDVASLTFTADNFGTPQTVTVSAIDDAEVEPLQTLSVIVGAATGGGYDGLDLSDVAVSVVDDDQATVVVTPQAVTTNETGTTATFDVTLGAPPTADVTITATVTDATEGSVSAPVVLNAGSLSGTFTVTGLDDALADGSQTYTITLAATSGDAAYDGITIPAVTVTNNDDDNVGVNVSPTTLSVNENGATSADFTVSLATDPGETVTIDLAISDATQASLSTNQLTFDSTNFATPQTVTATAIDDQEADGNVLVNVVTTMNASMAYAGLQVPDVAINVLDDDQPGITVEPANGLTTSEAGGTAQFTIVLNSQPSGDVTIPLTSSDTTEGTVSPASVTFTQGTWSTGQTITVTGVDDGIDDGNILYQIITGAATSADSNYNGRNAVDVNVTNTDNDAAGFIVTPLDGLETTEAGGTATFTVALLTEPTADVNIPIQVTDATEGSVSPQTLTFTDQDWETPQTVTVTGLDDALFDGPVPYTVVLDQTTSADASYNQLDPPNVSVTNLDDDAGFTVTALTPAVINEEGSGNTATFEVSLNSYPSQNVLLTLSGDGNEGDEYTFTPNQFVFTPTNALTRRTVTVTGVPDALIDGEIPWAITAEIANNTLDTDYENDCNGNCPPVLIQGATADSNQASVSTNPIAIEVTEGSGVCTPVTISLSTDNATTQTFGGTFQANTELSFQNASPFSIASGDTDVTVRVCPPGDDDDAQGDRTEVVTFSDLTSADTTSPYHQQDVPDITVTIKDDDTAGVLLTGQGFVSFGPFSNTLEDQVVTTEEDAAVAASLNQFQAIEVELTSQPSSSVIVTLTVSDDTEAILADSGLANTGSTLVLTFQPSDWDNPQQIWVVGQDDNDADGTQPFTVSAVTSGPDAQYGAGINSNVISGQNIDDDQPGWTIVNFFNPGQTTEGGGLNGCSLWRTYMNTDPTAPVDFTLDVTPPNTPNNDEIIGAAFGSTYATGVSLSNRFITMLACGLPDDTQDGDQPWTVFFDTVNTTDVYYSTAATPVVSGVNIDVDTAGISYQPAPDNIISLGAGLPEPPSTGALPAFSFDVCLDAEPTGDVSIAVSSSDTGEATITSGASLNFPVASWDTCRSVSITPQRDNIIDGDQDIQLTFAVTSTDANYSFTETQPLTITDIDAGKILFNPGTGSTLNTTEDGGSGNTDTITVTLSSIPTDPVTLNVFSFNTAEATVSPATVTLDSSNWNSGVVVTVTGQDDLVTDGDQPYQVYFDISTSNDAAFDAQGPFEFDGINADNETPGIQIEQPDGPGYLVINESGSMTDSFRVRLNTAPGAGNIVKLDFGDTSATRCGDVTTTRCARRWPTNGNVTDQPQVTSSVIFDDTNWNQFQTVTLTGENNTRTVPVEWFMIRGTVDTGAMNADPTYNNSLFIEQVLAAQIDNDEEAIVALASPMAPVGTFSNAQLTNNGVDVAAVTGETGRSAEVWIMGTDLPTANVDLTFAYSGEVTGPASFTLTQSNYNTPNPIVVVGQDDAAGVDANGYTPFTMTISTASADGNYDMLAAQDVQGYNLDNDQCQLVMLPPTLSTDRALGRDIGVTALLPVMFASTANPVSTTAAAVAISYAGNVDLPPSPRSYSVGAGAQSFPFFVYPQTGDFTLTAAIAGGNAGACYINAGAEIFYGTGQ